LNKADKIWETRWRIIDSYMRLFRKEN